MKNKSDEYIQALRERNPELLKPGVKITITSESFEQQLRAAFRAGLDADEATTDQRSLFERIFG